MFFECSSRIKDGKEHRSWSVVENKRVSGGGVVQRDVERPVVLECNSIAQLCLARSRRNPPPSISATFTEGSWRYLLTSPPRQCNQPSTDPQPPRNGLKLGSIYIIFSAFAISVPRNASRLAILAFRFYVCASSRQAVQPTSRFRNEGE
jgi:hypothetical protein